MKINHLKIEAARKRASKLASTLAAFYMSDCDDATAVATVDAIIKEVNGIAKLTSQILTKE